MPERPEPQTAQAPTSGLDVPLRVTLFPDHKAQSKGELATTLRALCARIRDTRAASKGALPWLKLAEFGNDRTDKGSLRHDANMLAITGVEGDYDGQQLTMDRARRILMARRVAAVLYTSPSHRPEAPRWRILCPTSRAMPPEDRTRLLERMNGMFVGALSPESWTLSQSYYYGAIHGAEHHEVITVEGRCIDAADDLDADALGKPVKAKPEAPAPAPSMARHPYTGDGTPYGRAALERECANIRNAGDGEKHHAVRKAAYAIGGLAAAGELPEGAAWSELSAALADIRHRCADYDHAQDTLKDCWARGMAAPRAVPDRPVTLARAPFGIPDAAPDYDPETGEVAMPAAAQHTPDLSSKPDVFPTLSLEEIMALPPPTWLVDKIITEGGFASLYAPPASYKSFVALSMALAVAYGDQWMGRPTKQCGVLYIAGEGARGLGKRIKAWQRKHGREDIDAPFRLLAMSVNLTDPLQSAKVIRTAMALAALEGSPIGLVVIDTVARSMAGADENSTQDMGRFVEACGAICLEVQAAVLGIHHTGKDTERGARGSNALLGGVDAEIKLERFEDRLTVTVTKQKDDEEGEPIQLCVEKVDIGTPLAPATSLVVVTNEAAQALAVGETLTAREERFKALADIAKVLGPNGRMTTARVCAAIGWSVGSRAYARMAEYVPMAPDCVEVTTLEGVARLWRIRETDKPNAALLVRRHDNV